MDINNVLAILGIVLGCSVVVGLAIWGVFPFLIRRGVNMNETFKIADSLVEGVSTMVDAAEVVMPNHPAINILQIVEKWAKIGVNSAEQLYITSQVEKDKRKEVAVGQVHSVLNMLGIDITPEMENIIDGAIEAQVMALGHKEQ